MDEFRDRVKADLTFLLGLVIIIIALTCSGCASCDPVVVYEPIEVKVPVPVQTAPLEVPEQPVFEKCAESMSTTVRTLFKDWLQCLQVIGRNVRRLEEYAARLRAEIEAHNAAVQTE